MSTPQRHYQEHTRVIAASREVLYGLVADVTRWPVIFGPSLHVRYLQRSDTTERFQLWARVNDEVRTWTSRRTQDARAFSISFEQERSPAPITSMGGEWRFNALPGGRTEAVLKHQYSADSTADVEWIGTAVDRNSEEELAALGRVAELGYPMGELIDTFDDVVAIAGTAADAYDFIYRSDLWPERLPHVGGVRLVENMPGIQDMEMDTITVDGTSHSTRSIRLCFPGESIVYKQLKPPRLLFGHSGAWSFADAADGSDRTLVTARHTVAIDPVAAREVLGAESTLADVRTYLREALGGNGRATIAHADAYARARLVEAGADKAGKEVTG
ncbi:MAG: aromatase/cyclase [Pseudonocardiaceae bacterium]